MKKLKFLVVAALLTMLLFTGGQKNVYAQENFIEKAKSAILISESGKILYEKNSEEKRQIASIVKLMTLKLVFDNLEQGKLNMEDDVVVSDNAAAMGGSQMFLDASSNHKLKDIIKGVIVASANDGAVVLAETVAGNEASFVKLMNEKAKEMGLTSSHFTDCTGLSSDHYSTAKDVALLASNVLTNDYYKEYSNIWLENYTHPSGRITELANTNRLIRFYNGCDAGKTGSTDEAGYCLTASAEKDNLRLISVVLGEENSSDRFSETKDLLNYGFNHFESKTIFKSDDVVEQVSFKKHHELVDLYVEKDLRLVYEKGQELVYDTEIVLTKQSAPIKSGEVVGEIRILFNGEVCAKGNLIVRKDVDKSTVFELADSLIKKWKI